MATSPRDATTLRGVAAALAGLPWALRRRRLLPGDVEAALAHLDEPKRRSRARRYER